MRVIVTALLWRAKPRTFEMLAVAVSGRCCSETQAMCHATSCPEPAPHQRASSNAARGAATEAHADPRQRTCMACTSDVGVYEYRAKLIKRAFIDPMTQLALGQRHTCVEYVLGCELGCID